MKGFLLGILTVAILSVVGYSAYTYGKKNNIPTPTIPSVSSPTPLSFTISDDEQIKQALFEKNNWTESDGITVVVSSNDGTYAKGTANGNGGGGYFFAIKVNNVWKIVADGNGIITCASLTDYPTYPTSLIPECFDQITQKIIKR